MNKFNDIHGEEPTDPPREWNIQPSSDQFKSKTSTPKTSIVVSAIIGIFNHHFIDNGDVEVHSSEFPVEYNSESVPYTDTTPIKSIYDDEMDDLLELLHSEHDDDIMDVDLQIIQA